MLTAAQLRELLARQSSVRKPIGRLAMDAGLLTEDQVQLLVAQQRAETPDGKDVVRDLSILPAEAIELAHQKFLSLSL